MNIGGYRHPDRITSLGKHSAAIKNPDPAVGRAGGAVSLVIGGLEDELHAEIITDRLDRAR